MIRWCVVELGLLGALAVATARSVAGVCDQGMNNQAPDLNGGPTMLTSPSRTECRDLCEATERCGAFVYHGRDGTGCLPINTPPSNLPPLFPAAQCFLKVPRGASTARTPDPMNCSCAGLPRPVCPPSAAPAQCIDLCPVAALKDSHSVACGRRRGFAVPGAPLRTASAIGCESACVNRSDCVAWSWTACDATAGGLCSLKNLVGQVERDDTIAGGPELGPDDTFSCTAMRRYPPVSSGRALKIGPGEEALRNATPWGYIQNPYHRVRHRSGNVRTHDRLNGVGLYVNANAPHDPLARSSSATLFVGVRPSGDGPVLLEATDFDVEGVGRHSPLHSSTRIAIAHRLLGAGPPSPTDNLTTAYFLSSENVLVVTATGHAAIAENAPPAVTPTQRRKMSKVSAPTTPAGTVFAILQLDLGTTASSKSIVYSVSSTTAQPDASGPEFVVHGGPDSGVWAFGLGSSVPKSADFGVYGSIEDLAAGLASGTHARESNVTLSSDGLLFLAVTVLPQSTAAHVGASPPHGADPAESHPVGHTAASAVTATTANQLGVGFTAAVARSTPESCNPSDTTPGPDCDTLALTQLRGALGGGDAANAWNRFDAADAHFEAGAVRLEGAWPEVWARGVAYDFATVRANIRPAVGVFKHPWDAMQVHGPRIVVAETSMDTMTLSYADVDLAKEVIYGLYKDTNDRGQPQAPCQNEDGTTNMECEDNHTAGTPPSWGAPLFTVQSIYARDHDTPWLRSLYPLLSDYLEFWLANRTDTGGYQICMCTWESGQDMMLRWGWNQSYGGDRSSRVIRAPEHQAAMAHAAGVMADFAEHLGLPETEQAKWRAVVTTHVKLTKSLYVSKSAWFCDFNSASGTWQSGCNDVGPSSGTVGAGKQTYQLAPLFFHSPALGVDLLSEVSPSALGQMTAAVAAPDKFGSDPPGSLTFASYCSASPVDPRCVGDIWAPHPFMTISAAGSVNDTRVAAGTTTRLLNRVWGTMDARVRRHYPPSPSSFGRSSSQGSPFPGSSYECWSINYTRSDGVAVGAMEQSCGSEEYAWTAEATTVTFLREVVGFREHPSAAANTRSFFLRPALPSSSAADVDPTGTFTVRNLRFRGTRFDLHLTAAGGAEMGHGVPMTIRMVEVAGGRGAGAVDGRGAPLREAEWTMRNGLDQVEVVVLASDFHVAQSGF